MKSHSGSPLATERSWSAVRSLAPLVVFLILALAAVPVHAQRAADPVAIVVHPATPADDISFAQLRRVFLGEQQFWSGRSNRITLLVRAPEAREREVVLNRIYRMNESQFQQYWIAKLFRAEVAAGPKIVYSSDMANDLVGAIPGAITFMPLSAVTPGVKVLRVDGRRPGEADYPLN
jgi:ABC-type phosphate transport system substrate-binding protein